MNFQYDEDASGITVRMSGELNFSANGDFRTVLERLAASKSRVVTFHLAHVSRID